MEKGGHAVTSIEQQLLKHIKEELVSSFKGDIQSDTDLAEVIDSTAIMELVVWIEGTFGFTVEIDDINPDNFGNVQRLDAWIRRNIESTAA